MKRFTKAAAIATGGLALAGLVGAAVPATAASGGVKQVSLRDDCDPVTFNAALGPGACVGDGDTTIDELFASLGSTGTHPKWRFNPTVLTLNAGDRLSAENDGGEAHTFTEVAAFGGGCVPPLNEVLGLTPVPECADPANFPGGLLISGMETGARRLTPGVHDFQCLVHPWMHTIVTVRGSRPR